MNIMLQYFRSLHVKSQFSLIEATLVLISVCVTGAVCKVFVSLFVNMSEDSFIFGFQEQDSSQIIIGAQFIRNIFQQQNFAVLQQLQSVNGFTQFYFQNENNITINKQNEACLPIQYFFILNTFYYIPRFCYQANAISDFITIPTTDQNAIKLNNIVSILNQYSLLYDQQMMNSVLQIPAVSDSLYFSQYPFAVQVPGYNISKLAWYINHMNLITQNPELNITHCTWQQDLFQGVIEIATVQSLLDKDNNIIGLAKQALKIMNNLFPSIPYNVLLINQDGQVIYQNEGMNIDLLMPRDQQQTIIIYNESQSGFDEQDWQLIKQNTNMSNSISLYSTLYNQTIQIKSYYFSEQNYTLLVYSNVTNNKLLLQQISSIINDANFLILLYTLSTILWTILLLCTGCIGLHYIFKPLEYITSMQKNQISQFGNQNTLELYQLTKNKEQNQQKNNLLKILQYKVINLQQTFMNRQYCKSEDCKLQENYYFPKQNSNLLRQFVNNEYEQIINNQTINRNKKTYSVKKLKLILSMFQRDPKCDQ